MTIHQEITDINVLPILNFQGETLYVVTVLV